MILKWRGNCLRTEFRIFYPAFDFYIQNQYFLRMIPRKLKIFLADDHEMILPGLKMAVESNDGCQVTGTATDGNTAFRLIMESKPDIAILDLSIPGLNGFEITKKLRENRNPVKIILLTSYSEDKYIREAIELKVDGYILKENSSNELIKAIESVAAGYKYITPKIMTKIVNGIDGRDIDGSPTLASDTITGREQEILKLISEGKKGREICMELNITESTLKTHKSNLMRKLNVSSVNELMLYALKNSIFSRDGD